MPTIASQLDRAFRAAMTAAFGFESDPLIGVAQNEKFGDYQSNAAMGLAKQLAERTGQTINPRAVAEQIKDKLHLGEMATEPTIAGPGFINVRLSPTWLAQRLAAAGADPRLGIARTEKPQTVVVDYSGPNIAKQMHVGHLRSTIIGDAIARTLDFWGDCVIRQNHLGDWGTQFGMLIAYLLEQEQGGPISATAHSLDNQGQLKEIDQVRVSDLEEFYRAAKQRFDSDPSFQDAARRVVVELQGGNALIRSAWKAIVNETRAHYQPLYRRLNVQLREADERGESFYNSMLADIVKELREKGLAVESEGATVVNVPGFETPLIIEKAGGGYLYGTTDLAAIRFRTQQLGASRIIYFVDARQGQHFQQVFWTAKQAGWATCDAGFQPASSQENPEQAGSPHHNVSLEHAAFGTMLGPDGKPFKTRSGDVVKLKDLLDESEQRAAAIVTEKSPELSEAKRDAIAHSVGVGSVKYADLSKDRTSDYVFAWERMLTFEGNTAPYLQNAYVRVHGIFRKAKANNIPVHIDYANIRLDTPQEQALAKHMLRLGEVIETVTRELKPHHLTNYLYELANRYHVFFENCPVLQSEEPTRSSRLALIDLTSRTLALGLDLLGIEHPEQM